MRKRMLKRILSLILSMVVVFTSIPQMPVEVHAETAGVVAVTNETEFMTALDNPGVSVIQLGGDIQFAQSSDGNDNVLVIPRSVTITGGSMSLWRAGIILGGNVTFENVSINFNTSVRNAIIANGYALTLNNVSANGTFNVDIFCGGISDYTGGNGKDIPASGGAANVTITNTNLSGKGGNIYAGNLSDVGNGAADVATTYGGSATINIGANTSIGQIYAHGARENRTGGYANEWIPSATLYPVTGNVTVNLNTVSPITVDGTTGGTQNAAFTYTDNGTGYQCAPSLTNVASISLLPSNTATANLAPYITGEVKSVSVPENTELSLINTNGVLSVESFAGGGTIIFPAGSEETTEKLTITGSVSGDTKVAIGNIAADGVSSSSPAKSEYTYVSCAGASNNGYSFTLLPNSNAMGRILTQDESGNWKTYDAQTAILVQSVEGLEDTSISYNAASVVYLPLEVEYAYKQSEDAYLMDVPVQIGVNDKTKIEPVEGIYTYENEQGEQIEFFFNIDETEIFGIQNADFEKNIPVGEYKIDITIPAEYMANGSDYTTSFTLEITCEHGTMNEADGTCPDCGSMIAVASVEVEGSKTFYATNEDFQAVDIVNSYRDKNIIVDLYQDVTYTYSSSYEIDGEWVLNLNGHTMTAKNEARPTSFSVGNTFIVNGPGEIFGQSYSFSVDIGSLQIGGEEAPTLSSIYLRDADACSVQINTELEAGQYEITVHNAIGIDTVKTFITPGANINLSTDWFVYKNIRAYCGELALYNGKIYFDARNGSHIWDNSVCTSCNYECTHTNYENGICTECRIECPHGDWDPWSGTCSECGVECNHSGDRQDCGGHICDTCGHRYDTDGTGAHEFDEENRCVVCGAIEQIKLAESHDITYRRVYFEFVPEVSGTYVLTTQSEGTGTVSTYLYKGESTVEEQCSEARNDEVTTIEYDYTAGETYRIEVWVSGEIQSTLTLSCEEHYCDDMEVDGSTITEICKVCGKSFSVDVEKETSRVYKSNETASIGYNLNGNTLKGISYYDEENNVLKELTEGVDYIIDTRNNQIIFEDSWLDTLEAGTYCIEVYIELAEKANMHPCPRIEITIEEACAKIGDIHYGSLEEAMMSACGAENQPVLTLLEDIYLGEPLIMERGVFTIDLNGKKVSGDENSYGALLILEESEGAEEKTITITDSSSNETGEIDASNMPYAIMGYGGDLIIEGGMFDSIYMGHDGEVIIQYGRFNSIYIEDEGKLTIYDGFFDGASDTIYLNTSGKATISGGTFYQRFSISGSTTLPALTDILAEDCYYYDAAGNIIKPADDATSIEGTVTVKRGADLSDADITLSNSVYTYTGQEFTPTLVVTMCGNTLVAGEDYTITYPEDMVNAGEKCITITTGTNGIYGGSVDVKYNITRASISDAACEVSPSMEYTGSPLTPAPTVTWNGSTLTKDTDYTLSYCNNTLAGTATITITGNGNFAGTKEVTFTITDTTAPKIRMDIEGNIFTDILDVITLGHFYKDGVDVKVTADGTGSAVAKVEYMISKESYANASLPTEGWTTVEKDAEGAYTFTVAAKNKGSVYAKVTDVAGNWTVVNSDGVVVYTDSVLITTEVSYTKTTKTDASISLNLNENTVASVSNGDTLLTETEYKVEGEKVVLFGNYLDTLALGHNTVTITVNPMGETYVESAGNDVPVALIVTIIVNKAEDNVSITSDLTKVYDGNKPAAPEYTAKSTGAVKVEYKEKSASDDTYTTNAPVNAGTYMVRVSVEGDDNYTESSATKEFAIKPATLTIAGATAQTKEYDGTKAVAITDVVLNGIKGTDRVSIDIPKLTASVSSANVGEYTQVALSALALAGDDKANYILSASTQTLGLDTAVEITKKPITVTAQNISKLYGAADPAFTYTVAGLVSGETLTGTLSRESGEDAGSYNITQGTLTNENNSNYDITFVKGTLTIKEAPHIQNEEGKMGWDVIRDEVKAAKPGDTVAVDMNGSTEIAGDVIDEIKGKDITISFDMGNGITWSVNGKSVTSDNIADINMSVTVGTESNPIKNIPMKVINEVTGDNYHMEISLAHNGEFGFEAVLTMNLKAENAGLFANLYYYNPQSGELEFISEDEIAEDGTAELLFTHASDYTIVIKENEATNSIFPYLGFVTSPKTGETVNYFVVIIGLVACVYWVNKKKCVR